MTFFIIPRGIAEMPAGVTVFGLLFFALLLMAGLTSSVSLVETLIAPMLDKFRWSRKRVVAVAAAVGFVGSALFALPQVINPGLENDGTMGLTLLDLVDHWVFSYGLLLVGLSECLLIGWLVGPEKIRRHLNAASRVQLGSWFDLLIKYVIPALIMFVLGFSLWNEFKGGLYAMSYGENYSEKYQFMRFAPPVVLAVWFGACLGFALLLTRKGKYADAE